MHCDISLKIEKEHVGKFLAAYYGGDERGIVVDIIPGSELPLADKLTHGLITSLEYDTLLKKSIEDNIMHNILRLVDTVKDNPALLEFLNENLNNINGK